LSKGLIEIGFTQSQYNMCLLWRQSCLPVLSTDDKSVTGPEIQIVEQAIKGISEKFTITVSDKLVDFLGVNINMESTEGEITFSQPQLIKSKRSRS
jgi:hypothetical protein